MTDTERIPATTQTTLRRMALDLHRRYEGICSQEAIQELVEDSYLAPAVTASVTRWPLDNPTGKTVAGIPPIPDQIVYHVDDPLVRLAVLTA